MSEPNYSADPVFYDNAIWVDCKVCGDTFNENEYDSDTCSECETKQQEEENK